MTTPYLFVYGSLKRGLPAHHLLAGQRFVATARTPPLYRLYDSGPYPCLVADPERGVAIHGEIWEVDEAALSRLDRYEGVPDLFVRQAIRLADFTSPVWVYLYRGDVSTFTDSGNRWPASS